MAYLAFFFLLIIGGSLNIILTPASRIVSILSATYLVIAIIFNIGFLAVLIPVLKSSSLIKPSSAVVAIGAFLGYFLSGYFAVVAFKLLGSKTDTLPNSRKLRINSSVLLAVSVLTGVTFLLEGYSKVANFEQNSGFFKFSGYSMWFMYLIMTFEILGGLGILLHFYLKTGPLAVAGLMIIMCGAVYTHAHNRDPFSDSFPAVSQFFILTIMLVIYYTQYILKRQKPKSIS